MAEAKGASLERDFAAWMKRELGYTETRMRLPVKGRVADRSYEVDIHAVRYSRPWDFARRAGLVVLILAGAMLALPTQFARQRQTLEAITTAISPSLAGTSLLILGAAAFLIGLAGKRRTITHAWVECKDTKGNVKRTAVQKLAASVTDVEELPNPKWRPDLVIMVAAAGFDADALAFAEEHGFQCYRRKGSTFERIQ